MSANILVVEDELMIRMLLEDMLDELGYTIAAQTGRIEEALEAARQSSAALRKRYGIRAEVSAPLSPETLEQLRSLGYVR